MFERGISQDAVLSTLNTGEVIDAYPTDQPYPSVLISGWFNSNPLHLVAAKNEVTGECVIITVYIPSQEQWTDDFRRRKSP